MTQIAKIAKVLAHPNLKFWVVTLKNSSIFWTSDIDVGPDGDTDQLTVLGLANITNPLPQPQP